MAQQNKFHTISCKCIFTIICIVQYGFCNFSNAQSLTANAGKDTSVCQYDSVQLGGNPSATGGVSPYIYSWQPSNGISNTSASNPKARVFAPTVYTLTVQDATGAVAVSIISVGIYQLPKISAGADQTIESGMSTKLNGTGGVKYYWSPDININNQSSATPVVDPGTSTTYCIIGVDANGCAGYDCMVLTVTPGNYVEIYNAFTPNGDGVNEVLFIGGIERFPHNKIEVFNRNGKLVFQQSPYQNNWDGKVDGTALPAATYYVVFTLGDGKGKKEAAVTIIR